MYFILNFAGIMCLTVCPLKLRLPCILTSICMEAAAAELKSNFLTFKKCVSDPKDHSKGLRVFLKYYNS